MPPLRKRPEDIACLAETFMRKYSHKYGIEKTFSQEAEDALCRYHWPGNVREQMCIRDRSNEKLEQYIADHKIPCPECGKSDFTGIRQFNLMFKTFQGVTEDSKSEIYLRPETAQGIFVNFRNVQRTARKKIPCLLYTSTDQIMCGDWPAPEPGAT